jgi:NAD+ synthase
MKMVKDPQAVAQYLSDWIRDYTVAAGKKRLVVGVSGGIDSAVVFRLCEMTGLEVLPVFMPLDDSQDEKLSGTVVELIGSPEKLQTVFIDEIVDVFFQWNTEGNSPPKALGNFAARMRMSILYYIAEFNDALVAGTTNLPEWELGYFTKWGDGAVDIEPIKGLLKEEVFQLGKDGFAVAVPDVILNAAPSANLWEGQTDEGEMGVKYSDLDAYCLDSENVDDFCANKIENMKTCNNHKKCETPSPDMSGIGSFRKGDK